MAKYRRPKLDSTRSVRLIDNYRKLLWFIIDDCLDSDAEKQEAYDYCAKAILGNALRRAGGQPMNDTRYAHFVNLLNQNPQMSFQNAADQVYDSRLDLNVEVSSLAKKFRRQYKKDFPASERNKTSRKNRKISSEISPDIMESDAARYSVDREKVIDDFLLAIEKALAN